MKIGYLKIWRSGKDRANVWEGEIMGKKSGKKYKLLVIVRGCGKRNFVVFVAAVGSTCLSGRKAPCHFAALIPVGYYCPSASLWAEHLFSSFIEAQVS